jgi:hypothetical protein
MGFQGHSQTFVINIGTQCREDVVVKAVCAAVSNASITPAKGRAAS